MQSQNPLFDDLARMAGGAMGALAGLRTEMETLMRQQLERFMAGADMVPREEFEVVRDMAVRAREENIALEKRLERLEALLAKQASASAAPKPAAPAKAKPAAKPRAAKPAKSS